MKSRLIVISTLYFRDHRPMAAQRVLSTVRGLFVGKLAEQQKVRERFWVGLFSPWHIEAGDAKSHCLELLSPTDKR